MSLLFSTIKFYAIGDSIAFQVTADLEPFLIVHKSKVRINKYNDSGIRFEHADSENDIAYVLDFSHVLTEAGAVYGISLDAVLNALSLVLQLSVSMASTIAAINATTTAVNLTTVAVNAVVTAVNASTTAVNAATAAIKASNALTNFDRIPGNSIVQTYYSGVVANNPSGAANIATIVYNTGATVMFTHNAANQILINTIT